MYKYSFFFLILFLFSQLLTAQKKKEKQYVRCSTPEMEEQLIQLNPNATLSAESIQDWIKPLVDKNKNYRKANETIIIPVVVHVIHDGDDINTPDRIYGENISYNQIISQINVLNQDFRRISGTPGSEVTGYGRGVDTHIEFRLATVAPDGSATNGIDRVSLCKNFWTQSKIENEVKPKTIWDPTKYFNIWTVRFSDTESESLGYAQYPVSSGLEGLTGGSMANTDGVVINYKAFGTLAEDDGSFSLDESYGYGRTTTHEVGHWLGLIHIWGDGDCSKDDYCDDTPNASKATDGCLSNKTTCGSLDMIENYMDYTYDLCMNTFTQDQTNRMITVLNNSPRRKELKNSTAFNNSTYQNDAQLQLNCGLNTDRTPCDDSKGIKPIVNITNNSTNPITSIEIEYGIVGQNMSIFQWTGNLNQFQIEKIELPIIDENYIVGENQVSAKILKVNQTKDDFDNNNTDTQVYLYEEKVFDEYTESKFVLEIKPDNFGSEIYWEILNKSNEIVLSGGPYTDNNTSLITEHFELSDNSCYSFVMYDKASDGICCGGSYTLSTENGEQVATGSSFGEKDTTAFTVSALSIDKVNDKKLVIYPNPTSGIINIDYNFSNQFFVLKIYDMSGKLLWNKKHSQKQLDLSFLTKGLYLVEIKDANKTFTEKIIIQ